MKITDLKEKRNQYIVRMEEITSNDTMTDELRAEWENLDAKVQTIDKDIKIAERQETLNVRMVEKMKPETEDAEEETRSVIEGLQEFFRTGNVPSEFRGANGGFLLRTDLTLTQLGADNKNKTVENSLSIAKSPAEGLMEAMGVVKFTGLTGDLVLPSMPQVSAGFASEAAAVSDASADPASLKLSARRLGAYNVVTKEVLNNSQPAIWAGVIQDIRDAWYRAQLADLFDQIQTDAVDASTIIAGSTLAYADIVNLQANVPYDMARPVYVATPAIAAFLKQAATVASINGPVWNGPLMNGTVDGIQAYATSLANTDHLLYFDAQAAVVGEWGPGIELLVNPYTYDSEGKIKVTISGLTDTGFRNYRFASWIADVSI